jgi:ABC-2 type transport system ATP-binding protein
MLRLDKLTKQYGKFTALDGLSLEIADGQLHGFVGPNGAGKTTTMRIISTLLQPTSGTAEIDGVDVVRSGSKARKLIGYMPDFFGVYDSLKCWEYLDFYGRCYRLSAGERKQMADQLLDLVQLTEKRDAYVDSLSRGMKQRLGIAQALINRPKLLICDEPTSALDPLGRKEILEIISSAKGETSVIFSTHILSDVEKICDDAAILEKGRTVLCGTVSELKAKRSGSDVQIVPVSADDAQRIAQLLGGEVHSGTVIVANASQDKMLGILKTISESRIPVLKIEHAEPDLEQLFMEVIGK